MRKLSIYSIHNIYTYLCVCIYIIFYFFYCTFSQVSELPKERRIDDSTVGILCTLICTLYVLGLSGPCVISIDNNNNIYIYILMHKLASHKPNLSIPPPPHTPDAEIPPIIAMFIKYSWDAGCHCPANRALPLYKICTSNKILPQKQKIFWKLYNQEEKFWLKLKSFFATYPANNAKSLACDTANEPALPCIRETCSCSHTAVQQNQWRWSVHTYSNGTEHYSTS